jgi:SAM-dependent methyltransferase
MFEKIYSLLTTQSPNKLWFKVLICIAIIAIIYVYYKKTYETNHFEGFTQNEKFILKRNGEIYDDFYSQIYDKIHKPDTNIDFIVKVIDTTQPSEKSIFLDIGSGTGYLANELRKQNYDIYGIDKSKAMVDASQELYPELQVTCGNIEEPMAFEKSTFSHLLCTHFTIYQLKDKQLFFRNCYFWLMPGGYLILHLVDPNKFDTIIPSGKPSFVKSPQKYAKQRITDTMVDFVDFNYKSSYNFNNNNNNTAIFTETFTDKTSSNIRQNEQTLYMENVDTILKIASENGFIIQSKINMKESNGDEYQYYYILERML